MSSFFEELSQLDRPWVDVKFTLRGRDFTKKARQPNAAEQDALDAFFADEYARQVVSMTEDAEGKQSELANVRQIYRSVSRQQVVEQIVATRALEIQREAVERSGLDIGKLILEEIDLPDADRKSRVEEREKILSEIVEIVKGEVIADYDLKTNEEVVEILSQININVKSQRNARRAQNAEFIVFALRNEDGTPAFPSVKEVRESLTGSTIDEIADAINDAFLKGSIDDLPFGSPGVQEPDKQPSSASTSEQETIPSSPGGKRTTRRKADSKQST